MKLELTIPQSVSRVTSTLRNAGFQAFLVGGCVRDLLLHKHPKDWDIATNAQPEEIIGLFPKTVYENTFGTVTVVQEEEDDPTLKNIEITPFRQDGVYSDHRHPDKVTFSQSIEEDIGRRDFTINALAYDPAQGQLVDESGGVQDLKDKIIRTVGEASARFQEDPLRILRAVRFATQLGFTIHTETEKAMVEHKDLLKTVSIERIRDEFDKILLSPQPIFGLQLSRKFGILPYFVPELEETTGVEQNGSHIYDVWEHTIRVVQHSADRNWPLEIRLASLFHDIGKPRSRRWGKEQKDWTFYGHEVIGAKIADQRLRALKYPNKIREMVVTLVRYHMFFSDTEKISLSAVRRIITNVGREHIWDLINLRICDRIGMGRPKEDPYRLRKYEAMIEESLRQPTSVGMLKIDGKRVMNVTRETAGPKIGYVLHALLEEVLEKPELNDETFLEKRAVELSSLSIEELKKIGESGKEKKEQVEQEKVAEIRKKHRVQ